MAQRAGVQLCIQEPWVGFLESDYHCPCPQHAGNKPRAQAGEWSPALLGRPPHPEKKKNRQGMFILDKEHTIVLAKTDYSD